MRARRPRRPTPARKPLPDPKATICRESAAGTFPVFVRGPERRRGSAMTEDAPWLVVGLGNPGREYAANRHNVGFMVADLVASRVGGKFGRPKRVVAEAAEGRLGFGGPKLIVVKPLTYMNL